MKNYLSTGKTLDLSPAGGAQAGQPLVVGDLPCVPHVNIPAGESGACATEGEFELEVTGHNAAGEDAAIEAGQTIYLDGDELNLDDTNGKRFGKALFPVPAGATLRGSVLLVQ